MLNEFELGQLVCSKAGRDQDRCYLVVGHDGDRRVSVADGRYRPVTQPKTKNVAHLRAFAHVAQGINQRLSAGEGITDELVRAALNELCRDLSRKEGD